MNKLKKIVAFMLASVLLMGVFEVNAYAVPAGTRYCTDVYRHNNPDTTYSNGYKTNELKLDDRIYFSYGINCPDTTAYVHYIVNGTDVGYYKNRGNQLYDYSVVLYSPEATPEQLVITDTELFESAISSSSRWHFLRDNEDADLTTQDYHLYIYWGTAPAPEVSADCGAHEHHFEYQTISEPTLYSDGMAGDVCTICGFAKNTQPVSAYGYAINDYASKLVNESKSGQTIRINLGEFNSFPKAFMEKVAAKSAQNVTFIFTYKWNHVKQEITIPAFSNVDTSLDWYGPATIAYSALAVS